MLSKETGVHPSLGKLSFRMGNPLQDSCLGNPTDREAWWARVRRGRKESNTTEQLNTHTHTAVTVIAVDGIVRIAALQLIEHVVTDRGVSGFQNQSGDSWLGIQQVESYL